MGGGMRPVQERARVKAGVGRALRDWGNRHRVCT